MWITEDEAVVMFARYCRARFGKSASRRVREKARTLEQRGDTRGHLIWNKVAEAIDEEAKLRAAAAATSPVSSPRRARDRAA